MTDSLTPPDWFTKAVARAGRESSIEVNGARIVYRVWGDDDSSDAGSVILIHGGAAHSRWWDHIAPLLDAGRQVIAFDLSGHGDSDARDSYDLATWAAEALAIARLSSSSKPIIVGHSLGGVVALTAAMADGGELGGIIIIDSPLVNFTPEEDAAADRMAFGPHRPYPTRDAVTARFRPIPQQQTLDYVASYIAGASVREVAGGWTWKFDSKIFDRAPQLAALAPLECKSAFIRGESGMVSAAMADAIFDGLGQVTPMIEIADAGHAIMLDQPLALVASLRTILAMWHAAA